MALDKNNKNEKFWAIRDVPERVRRKVKTYAAENGLTMAQAVEALVEGRYGSQADQELIMALMRVYGRVIIRDNLGAATEAEQVTRLLEERQLKGRIDPAFQLPTPPQGAPATPQEAYDSDTAVVRESIAQIIPADVMFMAPAEVVQLYTSAVYRTGQYEFAVSLLAKGTRLRSLSPEPRVAEILREYRETLPKHLYGLQYWAPVFPDPERDDRCEVRVKFELSNDDSSPTILIDRTFKLDKEYKASDQNAPEGMKDIPYWHWVISDTGVDEYEKWLLRGGRSEQQ